MIACHAAGLGLGWLQVKALNPPVSLTPQITIMTALGNIGNLPLVLIPALISRPGVLELISDSSSSAAEAAGTAAGVAVLDIAAANQLGLEYVMLGFFYASFIQFPLGYLLLQRKPGQQQQQQVVLAPQAPRAAASSTASSTSAAAAADSAVGAPATASRSTMTMAEPQQQQQQQQPGLQAQVTATQQPQQQQQALLPQQQSQVDVLLRGVFTPPVVACLLAVPVASVPELRSALFDRGGEGGALGLNSMGSG